jgi:hypothetical protein
MPIGPPEEVQLQENLSPETEDSSKQVVHNETRILNC